ncbi:hypothetical protein K7W03_23400 [Sphingobium sp. PNB]|uniref:hypothetical protein n=1 Tax=Sphingobium sp. PNB TaxID=863934 RepID=UPI001CA4084A|nr:hypothetical protein [Sphingobium sp. PNB]MCB4862541.1 hypothetical protein [Sphingobium sp. PNB]
MKNIVIDLLIGNALLLIGATAVSYAPDFRLPLEVATYTAGATFLTGALAQFVSVTFGIWKLIGGAK